MLINRTPLRISFLGGGTDLPWWYEQHGGAFLSTSINLYIYISSNPMFQTNDILLKYSKIEKVEQAELIQHPIAREVLKTYRLSGLDISIASDVPAGTGLGSSSSFTVGLLHNLRSQLELSSTKEELASEACHIEIVKLHAPIGIQDQYAAAMGGLNYFEITEDGEVVWESIAKKPEQLAWLDDSMLLVRTSSETRSASALLTEQRNSVMADEQKQKSLLELLQLTRSSREMILRDIRSIGAFTREGWELKKKSNSRAETEEVRDIITTARDLGSLGEKALGAGGGGFVLIIAEEPIKSAIADKLESRGYHCRSVNLDYEGVKIIYDSRSQDSRLSE